MSLVNLVIGAVAFAVGAYIGQVLKNLGITIARPTPVCDDPGLRGCGSNPRQCGTSQVVVFGPGGTLSIYQECGEAPATLVVDGEGPARGLDVPGRARIMFAPSAEVEVTVMHLGTPGRIEAFETSGSLANVVTMSPTPNVEQRHVLRGTAISRVDIVAGSPGSSTDRTLVLGWCH
jgi:hypothetical protein